MRLRPQHQLLQRRASFLAVLLVGSKRTGTATACVCFCSISSAQRQVSVSLPPPSFPPHASPSVFSLSVCVSVCLCVCVSDTQGTVLEGPCSDLPHKCGSGAWFPICACAGAAAWSCALLAPRRRRHPALAIRRHLCALCVCMRGRGEGGACVRAACASTRAYNIQRGREKRRASEGGVCAGRGE